MAIVYTCDGSGQYWGRWTGPRGNTWRARAVLEHCVAQGCQQRFPRLPWISKRARAGPFCSRVCAGRSRVDPKGARPGAAHHNWKGGRHVIAGYEYVLQPDHPNANKNGLIAAHRIVMERVLGRRLLQDETVHHRNGIRNDNRPENLELWSGAHPRGRRVLDLVKFAHEIIARYGMLPQGATEPLPREFKPYLEAR